MCPPSRMDRPISEATSSRAPSAPAPCIRRTGASSAVRAVLNSLLPSNYGLLDPTTQPTAPRCLWTARWPGPNLAHPTDASAAPARGNRVTLTTGNWCSRLDTWTEASLCELECVLTCVLMCVFVCVCACQRLWANLAQSAPEHAEHKKPTKYDPS